MKFCFHLRKVFEMTIEKNQLLITFNKWLENNGFYTGTQASELPVMNDGKTDVAALKIGETVLKNAIANVVGVHLPFSYTYTGRGDAQRAKDDLNQVKSQFDFFGFKTEWSTPILVLGLIVDDITLLRLQTLVDGLSIQVEKLRKYGLTLGDLEMGGIYTKLLCLYQNSDTYKSHSSALLYKGSRVNQVNGVSLRTCFIDVVGKHATWSQYSGFIAKLQSACRSLGEPAGQEIFNEDDIVSVLNSYHSTANFKP
jgi:hypothetical protein